MSHAQEAKFHGGETLGSVSNQGPSRLLKPPSIGFKSLFCLGTGAHPALSDLPMVRGAEGKRKWVVVELSVRCKRMKSGLMTDKNF
jgi:hypothetical protein